MISEVMTAVEVRHLESTVYGEMDNKKKNISPRSLWNGTLDKKKKTNEIDKSIWGGGKWEKKREEICTFIFYLASFHIDKKSVKTFTHLI